MLPPTIQVLLQDQVKLVIKDAGSISRKQVDYNDTSTYRNTFANHKVEVKPGNFDPPGTTFTTDTANLQVPGSPASATVVNDSGATMASRVYLDDIASAIEPHIWKKIAWWWDFWSGVIGNALTLTATLTSGNATIVVPDNTLLTPGQAIAGTNIPAGAKILYIPYVTRTTVILTHKPTGSGDVEATLTGSNFLGGCWEHEVLGGSEGIEILQ